LIVASTTNSSPSVRTARTLPEPTMSIGVDPPRP